MEVALANYFAWAAASLSRLGASTGGLPGVVAHSNGAPLAIILGDADRVFITGGVAESRDGEWWPIALSWNELVADWRSTGYAAIRERVEPVVLNYFSDELGPLQLDGDPSLKEELEKTSQTPNVAMLVAAAAAVLVLRRDHQPSQSENIRVFCELGAAVLGELPKEMQRDLQLLFTRHHGRLLNDLTSAAPALPMGGAKLRPLSLAEISHPGNPKLPAWRELFTDQLVNDLIANALVDGQLPFTAPQTFFMEGGGEDFFANHVQHEKYQRAQTTVSIRSLLEEARARTSEQAKKELADPEAVAALDTYLLRALRYVDARLVATDVVHVKFNSYVGRQLGLFAEMARAGAFGPDSPRAAVFRDPLRFGILWVDWLYTLYVLHSRVGIAHLDLHAGNIVVSHVIDRRPHHVYSLPGLALATHNVADDPKLMGAVIDFSRATAYPSRRVLAFLLPDQRQEYLDSELEQLDLSVARILDTFADTHADLVYRARTAYKSATSPALRFRAASALDVACVARAFLASAVNPSKGMLETSSAVEVGAFSDFIDSLADEPASFEELPADTWPALRALKRNFSHFKYEPLASPAEVLAAPDDFPHHAEKLLAAEGPARGTEDGGSLAITDGIYSVARAVKEKRAPLVRVDDAVREMTPAEVDAAMRKPSLQRWVETDMHDSALPLSLDIRQPAEFAQGVRAAWELMGAKKPPPGIFAVTNKKENYAVLHAERALTLQKLAAQHRKIANTGSTGSWVI